MAPESLLRLMKALTTQDKEHPESHDDSLTAMFAEHVRHVLSIVDSDDVYVDLRSDTKALSAGVSDQSACHAVHQLVGLCLLLLRRLRYELTAAAERFAIEERATTAGDERNDAPKLAPDVLSFDQNATVVATIQFVLALAVLPALRPGLAGSIADRHSKHSPALLAAFTTAVGPCPTLFRSSVDGLLDIARHPTLGGLLLTRYLADLLAATMQLAKGDGVGNNKDDRCQAAEPVVGVAESRRCSRCCSLSLCQSNCDESAVGEGSKAEQSRYLARMDDLIKSVFKPLLVRELLVLLQRAKKMSSPRPIWIERTCGEALTGVLLGPSGVRHVVGGMLYEGSQSWQQCDGVGVVIATCPSILTPDEYYKHIAPQVMSLLNSDDVVAAEVHRKVASCIVRAMTVRQLPEMKKHMWSRLAGPLISYDKGDVSGCKPRADSYDADMPTSIPAPDIENAIRNVFKVCCGCSGFPQHQLSRLVGEIAPCLFDVLCVSAHTMCDIRTECEQILQKHVTSVDRVELPTVFRRLVSLAAKPPCHPAGTIFSVDADGHLSSFACQSHDPVTGSCAPLDFVDNRVACLVRLVCSCRDDDLCAEFFLFLLQELNSVVASDDDDNNSREARKLDITPGQNDINLISLYYSVAVSRLVAVAYEVMGPVVCAGKPAHVLAFAKLTLERWVRMHEVEAKAEFGEFAVDTLMLALGLVLASVSDDDMKAKLTGKDWAAAGDLLSPLSHLERMAEARCLPLLSEMAFSARTAIATRGRVRASDRNAAAQVPVMTSLSRTAEASKKSDFISASNTSAKRKDLLPSAAAAASSATSNSSVAGSLSDASCTCRSAPVQQPATQGDAVAPTAFHSGERLIQKQQQQQDEEPVLPATQKITEPAAPPSDSVDEALLSLTAAGTLLPVRAHALISLRRHVEDGSAEAFARTDELLAVCEKHMSDSDSYVYLAAINCMAALADRVSERVLPVISGKYRTPPSGYSSSDRVKLGEVLVKTIRAMGDMAPKYRDVVLPAVLSSVRSDDELVRASSLANLAEACRLFRYSLAGYVHEVVDCARTIALSDRSAVVRQAATSTLGHMLRGIADMRTTVGGPLAAAQRIFGADVLLDLYRDLRRLRERDPDAGVRHQADIACMEVDAIVSASASLSTEMKKKIWVLDAPPPLQ